MLFPFSHFAMLHDCHYTFSLLLSHGCCSLLVTHHQPTTSATSLVFLFLLFSFSSILPPPWASSQVFLSPLILLLILILFYPPLGDGLHLIPSISLKYFFLHPFLSFLHLPPPSLIKIVSWYMPVYHVLVDQH